MGKGGGCIKGLSSQIIQMLVFDSGIFGYVSVVHKSLYVSSISYSAFMVLGTVFAKFGEHSTYFETKKQISQTVSANRTKLFSQCTQAPL